MEHAHRLLPMMHDYVSRFIIRQKNALISSCGDGQSTYFISRATSL
jgi:hypothetical protein